MYSQQKHWTERPTRIFGLVSATLGVVTAVLALAAQLGAFGGFRIPFLPGRTVGPSISLSTGQGPSSTTIVVAGRGFANGETVEIRFHTEVIATAAADDEGDFTANARVPGTFDAFAPQQFQIMASGTSSARSARASFKLIAGGGGGDSSGPARIGLSRGSGPSGAQVTVTGENFAAGEEVAIRFHTQQVGSAVANDNGRFSVKIRIPGSFDAFAPNQFTIHATGGTSVKSATRPFDLTK